MLIIFGILFRETRSVFRPRSEGARAKNNFHSFLKDNVTLQNDALTGTVFPIMSIV